MRNVTLALSTAVGLCVLAPTAEAQKPLQFGPEVSLGTNSAGPAIGARAVFNGMGVTGLGAYVAFDYFFPSSGFGASASLWEINANVTWDIPGMVGFKPYVGGGLNYARYSWNVPVAGTASFNESGLNLLGGAHFKPAPGLDMFGEVRAELRTGSFVAFTLGILF